MQNLDVIAKELFDKVRGRFPTVTIGDAEGNVTNEPEQARYFDFDFITEGRPVGKVSISLDGKHLAVVYGKDLITNEDEITKSNWYDFLKELRMFAKKRMMTFDTRDITKSNLNSRDYKFLAANRSKEEQMSESKLYGTSRTSYQNVGTARLMFKHSAPVNQDLPSGRSQHISSIYIESADGERFKYPYRHIAGARAMARHVAEGGKPFDDFGSHITGLSEELNKLRKFKTYMNRSSVMAESLAAYMDVVNERIQTVKKTIERIQKPAAYKEAFEGFEKPVFEEVPNDVRENWIDELTIKQFNEELADVFPYIYKLVSENTRAQELDIDDLIGEAAAKIACVECDEVSTAAAWKKNNNFCPKCKTSNKGVAESEELDEAGKLKGGADDPCWKGYKMVGTKKKGSKEVPNCVPREQMELESAFEAMLGQFSESNSAQPFKVGDTVIYKHDGKEYEVRGYDKDTEVPTMYVSEPGKTPTRAALVQDFEAIKKPSEHQPFKVGDIVRDKHDGKEYEVRGYDKDTEVPTMYVSEPGKTPTRAALVSGFEATTKESDDEVQEAYIKTSNDAIDTLGNLRKIGKKIETGQDTFDGNLANMYVNDVYDVISWVENNLDTNDSDYKKVLKPVIELRKKAKGMERELGSGKNARFGNEIVNTLYPLMQWIERAAQDAKEGDDTIDVKMTPDGGIEKADTQEQKTPLGEFILSYYDRETGEFPKGETAVLTMVEKDYGEEYIEPAKQFIERVYQVTEQFREPEASPEMTRMRELAGLR